MAKVHEHALGPLHLFSAPGLAPSFSAPPPAVWVGALKGRLHYEMTPLFLAYFGWAAYRVDLLIPQN